MNCWAYPKLCRCSRKNAYHGSSVGSGSLGGMAYMHSQGGLPIPDIGYGQCQIDTLYGPYGTGAVTLKTWTNNLKVNGLWSNDARRNAYAHLSGLDRRKLPNSNDSAHLTLTRLALVAGTYVIQDQGAPGAAARPGF